MKKLFLVLALLILGSFISQGAFAVTYPSCSNGGSVNNGTVKDRFNVHGWCIDDYGVLTPMTGMATSTVYPNSQGGMAVPVINITAAYSTYDTLIAQQTGNYIVDMGGVTSGVGSGGEYILPTAAVGLIYRFSVGTQSTITIDTLTNADTILNKTGIAAGLGINNTSKATSDSVVLVGNAAGQWIVADYSGTWVSTGKTRVH